GLIRLFPFAILTMEVKSQLLSLFLGSFVVYPFYCNFLTKACPYLHLCNCPSPLNFLVYHRSGRYIFYPSHHSLIFLAVQYNLFLLHITLVTSFFAEHLFITV